jgi:hypothetical protein
MTTKKSVREVLDRIYRDGLDGELSPEEYDFTQTLTTIAEIVGDKGKILQIINTTPMYAEELMYDYQKRQATAISDYLKERVMG